MVSGSVVSPVPRRFPISNMRVCRLILTLLLLVTVTRSARADKIDDYVRAQMAWLRIPGLSLAIISRGKVVKAKGYGLANVETGTPATPETVYKIGSVSKQFLSAGIMVLVQEGKIKLDAPVRTYLASAPDTWKDITVRHLLTHTSGIVREAAGFDPYKVQPDTEVIQSSYTEPLRFAPGEKWQYSNTGYYCLAEIIHSVSGRPWSEFINEHIFVPAGMTATRTTTLAIVPHRASGYEARGELQNAENWLALRPSGAFQSTVLDFVKWDAALDSDKILRIASRAQMWTPVTLSNGKSYPYGFGWFVDTVQGHKRVSHSGGVPGFVCQLDRYTDDKLTVVLMANVGNRDLRDMADRIASFYLPTLLPSSNEPTLPDREPGTTAQVQRILIQLARGLIDKRRFTPEMAANLTADMNTSFASVLHQLGPIQSLSLLEHRESNGERVYRYRLSYRNLTLFVGCTFNKDSRISRFSIQD